jgi:2-hydroxy-6-oxonona-2,4-dienedioate hydrolase
VESAHAAEAAAAVDRLLPRFGVSVARRWFAGDRVHYLEAGTGAPVVLLHAGFGGAGNWYRTLGPLSRHYRVVAPDRPGYGLSQAGATSDPVWWLDRFLTALGIGRVILVGHASGGALALAYAAARPTVVRALVLSDLQLLPAASPAVPAERPPAVEGSASPQDPEAWYAALAPCFDDPRLLAPEYLYYLWCLARLRPGQRQLPPGEAPPGPVPLASLGQAAFPTVPTLLIWGEDNPWAPVALARQLHRTLPQAWLRVIGPSRGMPALEQPGEFNHAVLTFLQQLGTPSGA